MEVQRLEPRMPGRPWLHMDTLWPSVRVLRLAFAGKNAHRKGSLFHRCSFEPPAGNLKAFFNDGHPVRWPGNPIHDIAT
jgi:hypothetical protein